MEEIKLSNFVVLWGSELSPAISSAEQVLLLQDTTLEQVREYLRTRVINGGMWDGYEVADYNFAVEELDEAATVFWEDTFGMTCGIGPLEEMFENFLSGAWLH